MQAPTAVTVLGIAWGVATTLSQLYISKKVEGRTQVTGDEIFAASMVIGLASLFAAMMIRSKEEEVIAWQQQTH